MAEASKSSDKPVTTAAFLQQIAGGNTSFLSMANNKKEETDEGEKIIIPTASKKTSDVVELEKLTEPLTPSPGKSSVSNMENLSDLDLQTLLQNFKDLSTDEQHNLINYLKKLETHEPERVERLRKFVNLDPSVKPKEGEKEAATENKSKPADGRDSPFSNRRGSLNPASEDLVKIESEEEDMDDEEKEDPKKEEKEKQPTKVHLDSEEEDYTFEDVVKAVSKNVKDKELESNMKIVKQSMKFETDKAKKQVDLNDAKALISNLMSNFSKGNSSKSVDLLGLGTSSSNQPVSMSSIVTSTSDFAKTLNSINVANLTSIVNNAKKLLPEQSKQRHLNFEPPSTVTSTSVRSNFDPAHYNRAPSPRMMDRMDSMGYDDPRRNLGMGRQGYDIGGSTRGPGGLTSLGLGGNLRTPMSSSFGGPGGSLRDNRGPLVPLRDLPRPSLNLRDRAPMQFQRNTGSYGSNYGNNAGDFPPVDHDQYPSRPNPYDQRSRTDSSQRFGSNPYNNRPGGSNYRW